MANESNEANSPDQGDAHSQAAFSEAFTKAILSSPAFVAFFTPGDGRMIYYNMTAASWIDPAKHVVPARLMIHDIIGLDQQENFRNQILPHAQDHGLWIGPCEMRDAWGSEYPVHAVLTCHKDRLSGNQWMCLQAVRKWSGDPSAGAVSVSDREFLHALLETIPDYIFFKDKQGRYIKVGRQLAIMFGHRDENSLLGTTVFDLLPLDEAEENFAQEQKVMETGRPLLDVERIHRDKEKGEIWISMSKFPLRDCDGNIIGIFGILRNVTERKNAERERRELELQVQLAQKLESIGRLASGVAHEINTPAQFITDNTHFIKRAMSGIPSVIAAYRALRDALVSGTDTKPFVEAVAKAERDQHLDYLLAEIPQTIDDTIEGLGRVTHIVRSLKEFSHPNQMSKAPFDLNRAIETTAAVSRHEWKYVANLTLDLDRSLPLFSGMIDQINQVVLNLIVNAAYAIGEAQAKRGTLEKGLITIRTRQEENQVVISVQDSGTGIPDAIKARIFDPFFTTKDVGKGTGQGLSIVRSIITKNHGGSVAFETKENEGTTFVLRLPITGAENANSTNVTTAPHRDSST